MSSTDRDYTPACIDCGVRHDFLIFTSRGWECDAKDQCKPGA